MIERPVPPNAQKLIDDARNAGHIVGSGWDDGTFTVRIHVDGDVYRASWWQHRGAMRFRSGHDGWQALSLAALRSFVTE